MSNENGSNWLQVPIAFNDERKYAQQARALGLTHEELTATIGLAEADE